MKVLICAAVDVDEASNHLSAKELNIILRELRRERLVHTLKLEPLTYDNMRLYIQFLFAGINIPEGVEKKLFHLSEGNPLILDELIQSLIDNNSIYWKAGGWHCEDIQKIQLSQSIKDLMGQKLESLSDAETKVLRYSSVVGSDFHYNVLEQMSDMDEEELLDILEGLCKRRILSPDEKNDMVYGFSHRTLRDVVYSEIQGPRRRIIHRKVATAIESSHTSNPDEVSHLLAHHYSQTSEHGKAFHFSIAAARRAYAIFAVEEALSYYHNALDMANKLDTTPENLIDIILDASRLSVITGDFESAQKLGRDASKLSKTVDNRLKEFESIFNEGWIQEALNNWTPAVELFSSALSVAEALNYRYGIARSYGGIGKIYWWQGEYEKAREYCERSADVARTIRDDEGLARSVLDLGNISLRLGEYDNARKCFEESISHLEKGREIAQLARAYNSLGTVYGVQKRWKDALPHYLKSLEFAEKIKFVRGIGYAAANASECVVETDGLEEARPILEQALESFEKIKDKRGKALVFRNYGTGSRYNGRYEKSMKYLNTALQLFREIGDQYDSAYTLKERALLYLDLQERECARSDLNVAAGMFEELGSLSMVEELREISNGL